MHIILDITYRPLVREYFGEQLQSQQRDAWKECNRRLYHYYRTLAPHLPASFREMEPLFLAVICGCNAGLFREVLHEVYIPRIQRGNPTLRLTFLKRAERYCRFYIISLRTDAGARLCN